MGVFKKKENWYIDYRDKGRRKRKKIGPSKKLAMQVLKDVQIKIAKGEYLGIHDEKKIHFEKFANKYSHYAKINKAPSTYYRRDRLSIMYLSEFFKGKYLFEISPRMIEKYKAKRLEKVGPATINREVACLKHMYTMAIEWEYINTNPVRNTKSLKEPPGRLRYLKPEEVDTLLIACCSHLRSIVITALNTGMRKSEILNLRWREVDFSNRKITVINSKNNESRVIPLNQTLFTELNNLASKSKAEYVFIGRDGHPFRDIKRGFASAVRRAKIVDFRFHDLRHTFGSHLVMQGVDLRTVQQVLGHKDIKMTMRYSHLSPEYVHDALERLDKLWTLYGHQGNYGKNAESVKL